MPLGDSSPLTFTDASIDNVAGLVHDLEQPEAIEQGVDRSVTHNPCNQKGFGSTAEEGAYRSRTGVPGFADRE